MILINFSKRFEYAWQNIIFVYFDSVTIKHCQFKILIRGNKVVQLILSNSLAEIRTILN